MKIKNITLFLCIFIFSTSIIAQKCDDIVAKKSPAMAINDFANVVSEETERALENTVRQYFDSTSIAVVVVIVPDMDEIDQFTYSSELFNCWGIGQKNDCGILLFISLKERATSIRTGRGVEFIATDIVVSGIAKNKVNPFLKEKNYDKAITTGVESLIQLFGTMKASDLEDILRKQRQEEEKIAQEAAEKTRLSFVIITVVIIVIMIFFLVRYIVRSIKKRKMFLKTTTELEKQIKNGFYMAEEVFDSYKKEPSWAQNEARQHLSKTKQVLNEAQEEIERAKQVSASDYPEAYNLLLEVNALLEKSFVNFKKASNTLREKIARISKETPERLIETEKVVLESIQYIEKLIEQGYFFETQLANQKALLSIIKEFQSKIGNINHYLEIYSESKTIMEKSNETQSRIEKIIRRKKEIDFLLKSVPQKAEKLEKEGVHHKKEILTKWKKIYSESVWREVEITLTNLLSHLSAEEVKKTLTEIKIMLSMERQDFFIGFQMYESLEQSFSQIEECFQKIVDIEVNQEKSRGGYPLASEKTKEEVEELLELVKDSDVSRKNRESAKKLSQELNEISVLVKRSTVDWVNVVSKLKKVSLTAKSITSDANADIKEEKRKRKRTSGMKNGYTTDSFPYFSGYSSSSNSISDFGGFGGGTTGGGGVDTNW